MEMIGVDSLAARALASRIVEPFNLVDVGCAGGIDDGWDVFGDRLKAFAFDLSPIHIDYLQDKEPRAGLRYVAGTVVAAPEGPRPRRPLARNPFPRFAALVSAARQAGQAAVVPAPRYETGEASPSTAEPFIFLPEFLPAQGMADIDFIKVDVDGDDLNILRSLKGSLSGALGVGVEVTFCGSDDPDENSFHNTDRLMRSLGFDLFSLTTRPYSAAALPFPYQPQHPHTTPSLHGRVYQGDALYIRDLAVNADGWSTDKLWKLAGLLCLFGLVDYAAEVLLAHRDRLAVDDALLDVLADEIQFRAPVFPTPRSYKDYMAAFLADDPAFYGHGDEAVHRLNMDYAFQRVVRAEEAAKLANERADRAEALLSQAPAPAPKRRLFGRR